MKREYIERVDPEWEEIASNWVEIKEKILLLQEHERLLREQLIEMADQNSAMGAGIKLTRGVRKGIVQYAQIPELEGVELDNYRKESTVTWTLTKSTKG